MVPLIAFFVVMVIVLLFIRNARKSAKDELFTASLAEGQEEPDFEKEFFARTEKGEKSQLLLSLASLQDCMLLRSLLHADGIPSHVEGEHMNNIYGGLTGTMTSVVAIKLYILCSDYDKAVEIIKDSKISSLNGLTIFEKEI